MPPRRPLWRRVGEGHLAASGRLRASADPVERRTRLAYVTVALLIVATLGGAMLTMGTYQRGEAVPPGYVETAGLVEEQLRMGSGQNLRYDTAIGFTAENGREYRFRSVSPGRVGEIADVAYDSANPGETAGTKADRRIESDWWIVLGALTVALGCAAFMFGRRIPDRGADRRAEEALERVVPFQAGHRATLPAPGR